MLKVHDEAVSMCRELAPLCRQIGKHDLDLARQLRRAASSVVLNLGEGAYLGGGLERARFKTALGSAAEVRSAVLVAEAFGLIETLDHARRDRVDKIIATLRKLTR